MEKRSLIGLQVPPDVAAAIDARLGQGLPGDAGFFENRSQLVRAALASFLGPEVFLATDAPTIRQRRKVQPVAPTSAS
jgi:Arc/MetJ-type ribon-helix-helix transcriptional regulator